MKKIVKEFRDFISRGNVMDMAVGVIVGGAFGKITSSLVNDVFMPFLGWVIGDIDLTLRYGADTLFTSLTAKVKMLDMITLNLNAALTDAGSPVDMSVFPENLESDARYQF